VLNPVVIPGLRAGICCAVLRGRLYVLSYVTSVRLSSWINKGDYYYYYYLGFSDNPTENLTPTGKTQKTHVGQRTQLIVWHNQELLAAGPEMSDVARCVTESPNGNKFCQAHKVYSII